MNARRWKITISLVMAMIIMASVVFFPYSHGKYSGREDFNMIVSIPQVYLSDASVTLLQPGYYLIEAWGGNGGNTVDDEFNTVAGEDGGNSSGVYYFSNTVADVEIEIGQKGEDCDFIQPSAAGGRGYTNGEDGGNITDVSDDGFGPRSGGGGGSTGVTVNSIKSLIGSGGDGASGGVKVGRVGAGGGDRDYIAGATSRTAYHSRPYNSGSGSVVITYLGSTNVAIPASFFKNPKPTDIILDKSKEQELNESTEKIEDELQNEVRDEPAEEAEEGNHEEPTEGA